MTQLDSPIIDVVNMIARTACDDTEHRIWWSARSGTLGTGDREHEGMCSLTLADLDRCAARVAVHLDALGVRRGNRVGIIARNRIEWVLLDLAVLKLGAVVAGIEPGRYEPAQVVREFGLTLLFTENATDSDTHDIGLVATWAEDVDTDPTALPAGHDHDPADIFAIKQTSGSTGAPKGIEATVASVNGSMSAVQQMFEHGPGDNLLVFLPVRYLQQRYWIYSALAHRHDITLTDRFAVFDVARATAPTVIMGVPGFFDQLRHRLETAGVPADNEGRRAAIQAELGGRIRYLWTGSAPAGRAMLDFFNDAGVPLYQGYGLNETCIVSKNHPGAARVGSVGKVLPHKRIRFDADGVLIVASDFPVNTRYTWSARGASEQVYLPTGEVKTYDLGHVDEDGFLYIDGRVDDIVTLSGALNILVPTVEERLCELPEVHQCAVFGDGQPFLSAVVTPAGPDIDHEKLADAVTKLNAELRYEQRVYAVVVACERFSMDNGLLGGQFKLKRNEIGRRYADELALVYQEHDVYNDGTLASAPVLVRDAAARPHEEQIEVS
ncbi:MAG TPA: AMP-binding protein [Pseudonocardiaceae bacterium]|jgi:long-subunit acyl-CoA synthetase (AMP-forming)